MYAEPSGRTQSICNMGGVLGCLYLHIHICCATPYFTTSIGESIATINYVVLMEVTVHIIHVPLSIVGFFNYLIKPKGSRCSMQKYWEPISSLKSPSIILGRFEADVCIHWSICSISVRKLYKLRGGRYTTTTLKFYPLGNVSWTDTCSIVDELVVMFAGDDNIWVHLATLRLYGFLYFCHIRIHHDQALVMEKAVRVTAKSQ